MKCPNPFTLLFNGTVLTTTLATLLHGRFVGKDTFGNRYFHKPQKSGRDKRWVLYNGMPEPSKVPPEWHGWLHYTLDVPPSQQPAKSHVWQKSGQPNLSGTKGAYLPAGHVARGGTHAAAAADYEPWTPH